MLPRPRTLGSRFSSGKTAQVASGSFKDRSPPNIRGTGYVVEALQTALRAFDRSDGFRDGALLAVNLGDDADTTDAYYRVEAISATRQAKLTTADETVSLVARLYYQSEEPRNGLYGRAGCLAGV